MANTLMTWREWALQAYELYEHTTRESEVICGAIHASTGAVCALSPGHSEPHRSGAVQWPRPAGYPDPPFDARD